MYPVNGKINELRKFVSLESLNSINCPSPLDIRVVYCCQSQILFELVFVRWFRTGKDFCHCLCT